MEIRRKLTWMSVSLLFLLLPLITWAQPKTDTAIFAGGCFWSMQHDFDKLDGVMQTTVGYTGGTVANPSYDQVSGGNTGHYEAIKIVYDPSKISYAQLLDFYWHDIDPTDDTGEFCDHGNEYLSAIFYRNAAQQKMAVETKKFLSAQFSKITTKILAAQTFYPAEEYHQKYAEKNPDAYASYRAGCRRDETLKEVWTGR